MKKNAHKCIISVKNMPWAAYNFIPIVVCECVCSEYYKKRNSIEKIRQQVVVKDERKNIFVSIVS